MQRADMSRMRNEKDESEPNILAGKRSLSGPLDALHENRVLESLAERILP